MAGHLVIAGGGHAHLTTLSRLGEFVSLGHRVTVIGPSAYHYYSGMAPGVLSGTYRPQETRFHIERMVQDRGGTFVRDTVAGVDPEARVLTLSSGQQLAYDILSFNIGSEVPAGKIVAGDGNVFTVKPIEKILQGRMAVENLHAELEAEELLNLVVVGGGPAGVEMAGALWALARGLGRPARIVLLSGGKLLANYPQRVRTLAERSLVSRGVEVLQSSHVREITGEGITLDSGKELMTHITFVAVGIRPHPLFLNSLLPTGNDGGLLVNSHLQSVQYKEVFGGGDCIILRGRPLAKVGVYAVRQNPILFHNLLAALEGKPLKPFDPGSPSFLLILNMGDGTAIFRKGQWIWEGRLAFRIKDYIDRKFMRKFQVSGELEEEFAGINKKIEGRR